MSSLPWRQNNPDWPRPRVALAALAPRFRGAAVLAVGVALLSAGYLLTDRFGAAGLALMALHAVLPAVALPVLFCAVGGRHRRLGMALAVLTGVGALLVFVPPLRAVGVHGHALAGLLACGAAVAAWVRSSGPAVRVRLAWVAFAVSVVPAVAVYAGVEARRARWTPPRYDAQDCYRFLTATTVEQAKSPNFPSALRVSGEEGTCQTSGCHAEAHTGWEQHAHARAGSNPAYLATFRDFTRRRGEAAGRWCQGCHNPDSQRGPTGAGGGGVGCLSCHGAQDAHALYGSAALVLGGGETEALARLEAKLRPEGHRHRNLRGGMQASAEFCGSCHRKNWNLPQNAFHWMPGPDEYRQWLTGPFSGSTLLTRGEATEPKSCIGCHRPHEGESPGAQASGRSGVRALGVGRSALGRLAAQDTQGAAPLQLQLFLRRDGKAVPVESAAPPRAGEMLELDVVVRNAGIGHDFPYGMPDLHRAWLEVEARDRAGKPVLASGGPEKDGTAVYSLTATDAQGQVLRHGDLDRMTAVREWRRIPAGEAELVRYRFQVPAGGLASFRARMLRQRRPDFSRWAGEPVQERPETLVEATTAVGGAPSRPADPASLRHYGLALARARLFPQAIAVLRQATEAAPRDAGTQLALGQVFLREGDLLAAGERFAQAEGGAPQPARAWQAVVARRSGQPEQAVRLLEPLVQRFPRDPYLRFELGRALMDLLRHREAAEQFEALLDVDPLDVAGHLNLMLCWQRLNRPADARREEALYQLLSSPEHARSGEIGSEVQGRSATLRVYRLEARR